MSKYIIMGSQWGDEGKGKMVDIVSQKMDLVVRFQGGANAGHTVIIEDKKFVLHLIPSGVISGKSKNIIGNGCVIDPVTLSEEMENMEKSGVSISKNNFFISAEAHIVTPLHKILDKELNEKIGTTSRGIGPTYMDKVQRSGIRMESILDGTFEQKFIEQLAYYKRNYTFINDTKISKIKDELPNILKSATKIKPFITDTKKIIYESIQKNKNILYEGAQGTLLDIDHGTYPFVTSSSTTIGGALTGAGVFIEFDKRIGIMKSYTTRVGEGPFPTELRDETGEKLRANGNEFGATTGRPRRCGWLDLPLVKKAIMLNGFNYLIITKLSVLSGFDKIKVAIDRDKNDNPIYKEFDGWEKEVYGITDINELPKNCINYINFIEEYLNVPIGIISTGPNRKHLIVKNEL
ncbi:MAG: adenylosuccinate synthase [Bacteroidota bacterium]|nr:adenylosuccinate synthase [Bacteroidota bacterium]